VCPVCENENKPLHRCCDFCWNLRPDWLPYNSSGSGRPIADECRDHTVGLSGEPAASLDSGIMSPGTCGVSLDIDNRNPASPISPEIPAWSVEIPVSQTEFTVKNSENKVAVMDTKGNSLNAEMQCRDDSRSRKISDLTDSLVSASSSMPCVICLTAAKNASIVHGTTGHQACCFRCARQLKHTGKPCPVCRRPIHKVIRNYIL